MIRGLNQKKASIDSLKDKLSSKQTEQMMMSPMSAEFRGEEYVIDEEEYSLLASQQQERQSYRQMMEDKRSLDDQFTRTEQEIQLCKTELVQAFESWYARKYPS